MSASQLELEHGRYLRAVAYRMLGSIADAEDVVQDAFARYLAREGADVAEPRAFMTRVVTRLCLDQLKSARVRRETYVGTWLPEPALELADSESPSERADQVTFAMMHVLERLSPLERAAFLLHDVFGQDYDELAEQLERNVSTCRKLVERARGHMHAARPRFSPAPEDGIALAMRFFKAVQAGDGASLTEQLVRDAVLYSDGGGKRPAALNPIDGASRIVRFFLGIRRRWGAHTLVAPARISGSPGLVVRDPDGHLYAFVIESAADRIAAVYLIRNPDKLTEVVARYG